MINNKRSSFFQIVQNDVPACFATIFFIMSWGYYIYEAFFSKNHYWGFLVTFFCLSIISLMVLLWRYKNILTFFEDGVESKAIIDRIGFFRDRGEIAYIHIYGGNKYLSVNAVMKTKRTRMFDIGEEIDILIDRNNPKRAIIRNLYL